MSVRENIKGSGWGVIDMGRRDIGTIIGEARWWQ